MANQAARYFDFVGNARKAYEEHSGPKVLVRYEDLLADPLGTVGRLYSELGMELDEERLAEVVGRHTREQLAGKEETKEPHHEAASPNWRQRLSPEQAEVVERVTAPLLNEFYPG